MQYIIFIIIIIAPFLLYGGYLLWVRSVSQLSRAPKSSRATNPGIKMRMNEPNLSPVPPAALEPAVDHTKTDIQLEPRSQNSTGNQPEKQAFAPPADPALEHETEDAQTPKPPASIGNKVADQDTPQDDMQKHPAVEDEKDRFPEISSEQLNEFFYYVVRVTMHNKTHTAVVRQLGQKLSLQAKLQMHQLLFGYDDKKGVWENPRSESSYRYLIWAVPLCNRKSHIEGSTIAAIVTVFQDAMRSHGGNADFTPQPDIDQRLVEVNEFCDRVDHKVTLMLLANREDKGTPRRCGDIISLAQSEKIEEIDGSLQRVMNGEVWFRLYAGNGGEIANKSPDRKIASLVLEMDFPHVSSTETALQEMFVLAGKLARVLRFRLVDANQDAINEENIEDIKQYILELRGYMQEFGVRPGSRIARALFS